MQNDVQSVFAEIIGIGLLFDEQAEQDTFILDKAQDKVIDWIECDHVQKLMDFSKAYDTAREASPKSLSTAMVQFCTALKGQIVTLMVMQLRGHETLDVMKKDAAIDARMPLPAEELPLLEK